MRLSLIDGVCLGLALLVAGCGDPGPIAIEKTQQPGNANVAAADGNQPEATVANAAAKQSEKAITPESAVPAAAIDEDVRQPATVGEAAKVIDLSVFPLMPGSQGDFRRVVANRGRLRLRSRNSPVMRMSPPPMVNSRRLQ